MVLQLRQIQRGLDYEFQSDTALRNKIVTLCSNIPTYSVAILQQTSTIAGLVNNIYTALENHEEAIKAERSEPLGFGTYFTNRKYYTNRPPSHENHFQKKQCIVYGKTGCWSTKHTDKKRQKSRNKFTKRFSGSINKRYNSYIQEYKGQEEEATEDFEALILDIQDTELEEAENFVTSTVTSNHAHARYYLKLDIEATG